MGGLLTRLRRAAVAAATFGQSGERESWGPLQCMCFEVQIKSSACIVWHLVQTPGSLLGSVQTSALCPMPKQFKRDVILGLYLCTGKRTDSKATYSDRFEPLNVISAVLDDPRGRADTTS